MSRILILAALIGCGGKDDGASGGGGDGKASATPRDAVVDAWKQGGLEPGDLTAATVAFGKDCKTTAVGGVDVLLCNYDSADAAKKADASSNDWIAGAPTGSSFVSGKVLVVVADRKKADPDGKTINQLMKLTPK